MIIWKEDKQDRTLFTQNPCNHRGFFLFNNFKNTQNASNTWHHHPPQQPILGRCSCKNQPQIFSSKAKPGISFSTSADTSIPPAQSPHTLFSIAITDTIGVLLHQQAADELGGNLLGGTGEERLGEALGGRGDYGNGYSLGFAEER
jgi:hypothetical protein